MSETRTRPHDEEQGRLRDGLSSARDKAAEAARRTAEGIDANPLGIVVGGLALGVVAGALLPRSDREKELLAPLGATLNVRARAAIDAARDAGKGQLDELGISRDAARDQVRNLFDGLTKAVQTAGAAAARSAASGTAQPTGDDAA